MPPVGGGLLLLGGVVDVSVDCRGVILLVRSRFVDVRLREREAEVCIVRTTLVVVDTVNPGSP